MPANNNTPSLQGCRIALTLEADAPHSPADALREREAALFFYPVAQILPPDSLDALDRALMRCKDGEIDWLLLTTPCAVEAVAERMAHLEIEASDLHDIHFAFYGAMTRMVAAAHFSAWQSRLPDAASHAHIIDAMNLNADATVVVPLAQRTRADRSALIAATGADAIDAPAYRLILGRGGDDLPGLLWGGLVDAIVFPTENSVRHFATRLKAEGGSLDMLDDVVVACLDPQSAAAARAFGLPVTIIPDHADVDTLADALATHFSRARIATE